jgi:hypothetical protein
MTHRDGQSMRRRIKSTHIRRRIKSTHIADSALEDGQIQLSSAAAHISHSGFPAHRPSGEHTVG